MDLEKHYLFVAHDRVVSCVSTPPSANALHGGSLGKFGRTLLPAWGRSVVGPLPHISWDLAGMRQAAGGRYQARGSLGRKKVVLQPYNSMLVFLTFFS